MLSSSNQPTHHLASSAPVGGSANGDGILEGDARDEQKNGAIGGTLPDTFEVAIAKASSRKDEKGKNYSVFHVDVKGKDASWICMRRFSQFDRLHKHITQRFPGLKLPSLPPKKWIGTLSGDFVDKRRVGLEKYLRNLLALVRVRNSEELIAFLQNDEYLQCPTTPEPSQFSPSLPPLASQLPPQDTKPAPQPELCTIISELTSRLGKLEKRCEQAEYTAATALRIAQLAAGSLTQEAKRKLERKVRDEVKNLNGKRGTLQSRRITLDGIHPQTKPELKLPQRLGKSMPWLPNSLLVDSDEDDRPKMQTSSLDRKRYKRRVLEGGDQSTRNLWGPESRFARKAAKERSLRRDNSDTFDRYLRLKRNETAGAGTGSGTDPAGKRKASGLTKSPSSPKGGLSMFKMKDPFDAASRTPPAAEQNPFLSGDVWGPIGDDKKSNNDAETDDYRRRARSEGILEPPLGIWGGLRSVDLRKSLAPGSFMFGIEDQPTLEQLGVHKKRDESSSNPHSSQAAVGSAVLSNVFSSSSPSQLKTGGGNGNGGGDAAEPKMNTPQEPERSTKHLSDASPIIKMPSIRQRGKAAELDLPSTVNEGSKETSPESFGQSNMDGASAKITGTRSVWGKPAQSTSPPRPKSTDEPVVGKSEIQYAADGNALRTRSDDPSIKAEAKGNAGTSHQKGGLWENQTMLWEVGSVLKCLSAPPQLTVRRHQALEFITDLIRRTLGAQVYPHGSFALRTDLPDSDLDVSAYFSKGQSSTWVQRVVNALCQAAGVSGPRHLSVRTVTFVNAEVPIVKAMVGRIPVDISGNQVGALEALSLFEACDRLVGKDHLLKRTAILMKAWAKNEASILGAKDGMMSSFCLRSIVLFIFNAFYTRIQNPIQGLFETFRYLEDFPWPEMALGLYGPIYLSQLPNYVSVSGNQWAWPAGVQPLFPPSILQRYSVLSRPHSGKKMRGKEANKRNASFNPSSAEAKEHVQKRNGPPVMTEVYKMETAVPVDESGKKQELTPRLMTVMDPTNPFNNLARSISNYKHARVIQKKINSAARTMRNMAERFSHDQAISSSQFITSVMFLNTVNRYRSRDGYISYSSGAKPSKSGQQPRGKTTSDTEAFTETELSNFSDAPGLGQEPYMANLSVMEERLAHARQFEAPSIGEEQLVALVAVLLDQHGAVPIGKMGSMLHNATNNHSLPAMIKSKYGGLKRFLLSHTRLFRVGVEHPFNPPVTLLQPPTGRQRELVNVIVKSSGGSLMPGHGPKLPPKPAGMGNRRDRGSGGGNSANRRGNSRRTESPSSVKSVRSSPATKGGRAGRRQGGNNHRAGVWGGTSNVAFHPNPQVRLNQKVPPTLIHHGANGSNSLSGHPKGVEGESAFQGSLPVSGVNNDNPMAQPNSQSHEAKNANYASKVHLQRGQHHASSRHGNSSRGGSHVEKSRNRRRTKGVRSPQNRKPKGSNNKLLDEDDFPPLGRS